MIENGTTDSLLSNCVTEQFLLAKEGINPLTTRGNDSYLMIVVHRQNFQLVHVEEHGAVNGAKEITPEVKIRQIGKGLQRVWRDAANLNEQDFLFYLRMLMKRLLHECS